MNNLKVFESPDLGKVRVVERSGEPWFVAADVCRALGLDSTGKALTRLDDDEKGVNSIHTLGGSQMMTIINESGLYALVLGSRKPEAKAFKRWVTHKVLPAIRRTGRYRADGVQPITPAMALEAAQLLHGCQPAARRASAASRIQWLREFRLPFQCQCLCRPPENPESRPWCQC